MKRRMKSWATRFSLLGRFTAMGLVVVAALGLAIGLVLKHQIEQRAREHAVSKASVMAEVGLQTQLQRRDLRYPNTLERLSQLDSEVGTRFFDRNGIIRVKFFNRDRRLVYSDDRTIIGDRGESHEIEEALEGEVISELAHGTHDDGTGGMTLEVYVPVRMLQGGEPVGVLEVYMTYAPVASEIRRDVLVLALLLGGGLVLLFGTLFRIVAGASRQLRAQALHDALTGLPNRTLLHRRAERALRGDDLAAMLLIDLDRFKEVNDTLGHDYGDALLIEVAERLQAVLRRGDTLARIGGDEFAVLLDGVPDRAAAVELAGRLQEALRRPFALRGVAVELEASIGVALYPEHGETIGVLLQRADVAMYDAKRGRHGIATYSRRARSLLGRPPRPARRAARRRSSATSWCCTTSRRSACAAASSSASRRSCAGSTPSAGCWARTSSSPSPSAPAPSPTSPAGWSTTRSAQCRDWRDRGIDLPVAVNLAGANIVDVTLPDAIGRALERYDLPADRLECEITEHTVMVDPVRASDVLDGLRALGVGLSLDDFGTGHSSLSYLKRLPLDEVKIDRSFVAGMADDENDAVIVRSTIDLAHNLGLRVVAEGVETAEILGTLRELRCDVAQGYHISRPLPAGELDLQALSVSLRGPARKPSSSSTVS